MQTIDPSVAELLRTKRVLIVDDEASARKVVRTLLTSLGVRQIVEATDGKTGIEAILSTIPDAVLVDWQMPGLDGPGFLRWVRHPGAFPYCDVPIVMLTGHAEKSCVTEAIRLGVHEYLLKPVSAQSLLARLVSIFCHPRRMVQRGGFYGPEPRDASTYRPDKGPLLRDLVLLN